MILGVDVSRWNTTIDWALLKASGVEFAFIKATQGNYATDSLLTKHVEGAKAAGMIVGLYHWCDPLVKYESQAQYFLDKTKWLPFDMVAADVEQQWADWVEWSNNSITKILSPEVISDNAKNVMAYLDDRLTQPVVLYSRASFINAYARPMQKWASYYPLWMAHYPYNTTRITTAWDVFKAKYLPSIPGPALPAGSATWKFWQFTGDKFVLPGCSGALDINYFNGDLDQLKKFVGQEVVPPVVPPAPLTIEDRVTKLETAAKDHGWNV